MARTISAESVARKGQGRTERARSRPPFELSDSKLQVPLSRPGIVARPGLLDRLNQAAAPSLIWLTAPAGYGKTTLLAQWADSKRPRAAWLSADQYDNDPTVLLTYLATALDRIEPLAPVVFRALAAPSRSGTAVLPLASALRSMTEPVFLVLDHAEAITNRDCLDIITELSLSVPTGSRLAIASRRDLGLPTARLRAEGRILEIGAAELAMDEEEASRLLDEAGVNFHGDEVRGLVERTEGWPVGLYLAALAVNAGSSRADAVWSFTGDDRYVGDYLRSEFLNRRSRAEVSFLTRTAVLERMCGPLCDATLNTRGSDRMLAELDSRNLLVVPLDRRRHWYRYHQLFRQLLHAELKRREPERVPDLHLRAAAWHEANGAPESAIEHAQAAGDADRVAELVLKWSQPVWATGRENTVLSWMEWLEDKTGIEDYAVVAVHGALIHALLGRPGEAERWATAAEEAASTRVLPNGDTTQAHLTHLRALLCHHGVAQARKDAQVAWEGLNPASHLRATMLQTEGISFLVEGDLGRADAVLARAVELTSAAGQKPVVALLLAERALVAIGRSEWLEAEAFIGPALGIIRDGHFEGYWTSALVYACAARVSAHRGDVAIAREHAASAARLRPLLTYALPVVSVQALLELGRAYLALGETSGARAVLRQAQDIFQQRPDLGSLPQHAVQLRTELGASAAQSGGGASSLTTAELRLLPLLATHFTLKEIGDRLYLSRNTVKTQAAGIYRKFGVTSRSEAITRMHRLGLLTDQPLQT